MKRWSDFKTGRGAPAGPSAGASAAWELRLDVFQGPLDLLLYLIERDELDIRDIPIAHVTDQYLQFLASAADSLDLDQAGEFLVMAATLCAMKARTLCPPPRRGTAAAGESGASGEGEALDPAAELSRLLLEYSRFKQAAAALGELYQERERLIPRWQEYEPGRAFAQEWRRWVGAGEPAAAGVAPDGAAPDGATGGPTPQRADADLSPDDLLRAFAAMLARQQPAPVRQIKPEQVSLRVAVESVRQQLARRPHGIRFGELFPEDAPRLVVVVTFLALLELVRRGEVRARQERVGGEILLVAAPQQGASAATAAEGGVSA